MRMHEGKEPVRKLSKLNRMPDKAADVRGLCVQKVTVALCTHLSSGRTLGMEAKEQMSLAPKSLCSHA